MRITGREKLSEFMKAHTDAKQWMNNWVCDVEGAAWKGTQDIKDRYASVSFVKKMVIFNVKGRKYRLEVQVAYGVGLVNIVWVGTHAEYDKRNRTR